MWRQALLAVFNFKNRNKHVEEEVEKTREVGTIYARRSKGDWCAEDPNSWYYGPLEFFEESEERSEAESTTGYQ